MDEGEILTPDAPGGAAIAVPADRLARRLRQLLVDRVASTPEQHHGIWLAERSANRRRNYEAAWVRFAAWLEAEGPAEAAATLVAAGPGDGLALLHRWRADQEQAGYAPETINLSLSALSSFLRDAHAIGLSPWKPVGRLTLKTERVKANTKGPSHDSVSRILAAIPLTRVTTRQREPHPNVKGIRDLALLRLIYTRGLRRFEATGCDLGHWHPETR